MAKLEIIIDARLLMAYYNKGLEDGFMLAKDFNELEEELNLKKIDTDGEDNPEDI